MGQPKTIDFYRCTRPVQDRFVAATSRSTPPAPLLFRGAPRTRAWALFGLSAVFVAAAAMFLVRGWGDASSPLALHGRGLLGIDVLLLAAAAYCFVHAAAVLRAMEALPYRAGMYVFPACVVDASGPVLRVWSLDDAEAIERLPRPALALRMRDGERVVVPAARPDEVERADAALTALRPELHRALAEDDIDMLVALDPLAHTRVSSPISSTLQMRRFAPAWMRFDWALAAAIGAALGLGLGSLRNASSDERMFRTVAASLSVPLYEQYLARGGRRSGEVRDVLLPRAELQRAQAQGRIDVLQTFARDHASAQIGPEIDAAMRRLLLVELDKATRVGTVAALDAFAARYPDSHLDLELGAARHALYVRALAAWKAKARVEPATAMFVERLLAAAEKAGPSCQVRFRLRPSKTLPEAEKRITKHVYYPGPDALVSHYVTGEALRPREQRVAQSVAEGFSANFPADLLAVRPGEPLAPDAPDPAGAPVLVIDYSPEWSGVNTTSAKPRTLFAGIRLDFAVRFELPEGAPLELVVKSLHGPELWKLKNTNVTLSEFEQKVYDPMIEHGFDDLLKRLNDTFFRGQ